MTSALFSPIKLADLELANRIAVSPMCQYSANDGVADDWHMTHLGMLANSGASLLVIEATHVERHGRYPTVASGFIPTPAKRPCNAWSTIAAASVRQSLRFSLPTPDARRPRNVPGRVARHSRKGRILGRRSDLRRCRSAPAGTRRGRRPKATWRACARP